MGGKKKGETSPIVLCLISLTLILLALTIVFGLLFYVNYGYQDSNSKRGTEALRFPKNQSEEHTRVKRQVRRNDISKFPNVNTANQKDPLNSSKSNKTSLVTTSQPHVKTNPLAASKRSPYRNETIQTTRKTRFRNDPAVITSETLFKNAGLTETTQDPFINVKTSPDPLRNGRAATTTPDPFRIDRIVTTLPVPFNSERAVTTTHVETTLGPSRSYLSVTTQDPQYTSAVAELSSHNVFRNVSVETTSSALNAISVNSTTTLVSYLETSYPTRSVNLNNTVTSDVSDTTTPIEPATTPFYSNSSTDNVTATSATQATTSENGTTRKQYPASKIADYIKQAQALQDLYSSAYRKLTQGQHQGLPQQKGNSLRPLHYDIEIRPNMYTGQSENFTLYGYVRIKFLCVFPTDNVTLYAEKLWIKNETLSLEKTSRREPISITAWEMNNSAHHLVIYLQHTLMANDIYYLKLNYTAPLLNNSGLSLSRYEQQKTVAYVVSTRFSSSGVREVFPCIDEPGVRSTFSLTIVRRNPVKSIAGTSLVRIELRENGWLADVYRVTPPLSPKQLTFTVGDLRAGSSTNVTNARLPVSLYPVYYEIEIRPNIYGGPPESFTFDGFVNIQLRCDIPTRNISLHTNQLSILDGTLAFEAVSGTAPSVLRWEWNKNKQFMVIYLDRDLVKGGLYYLKMNYTAPIKDLLSGLYLSQYDRNNQRVYLATTQLQPTYAREVFPCFDEPAVKSYFYVTLLRKNFMKSFSNMPISRMERRGTDWVADIYQRTPIMSTYLLSFIICDFDYQNATTNNILYRTWSRPDAVNDSSYSLAIGTAILTHYEDYFNIRYPLPKQDMIAVPDLPVDALENWGITVYRETAMMFNPNESSEVNKQHVANVVANELAQQWFGNLVTPSWWDDLWLNKGLSTYVKYMGVAHVHPDWKMFDQFVFREVQDVFEEDALVTSHPLYIPVASPGEISEIFDGISYAKGASVIRMMQFFLGEKTFKAGLSSYLQKNSYTSAFHADLWSAMTESARAGRPINLKGIMDTWTLQMNYPVVMVTRLGRSRIRVTQQRYLKDPNAVDSGKYKSDFGYRWEIPFVFTSSKELKFNKNYTDITWIRWTTHETVITNPYIIPTTYNSWIIANPMQYGYYRVNYDTRNWEALVNQLKTDHTKIAPANRAQIINDALNLAKSDITPMAIALKTLEYIDQEFDYVPRAAANKELDFLARMLPTDVYGAFQSFMKSKIQHPFSVVGINNTRANHLESFTRSAIVETACNYGVRVCISEAARLYRQWMANSSRNPIDPDLRETVYCTAVKYGSVSEWDFAFSQYTSSPVASESDRLLTAMGCSRQPWILKRYMERALDPSHVRKQDALRAIIYVTRKPAGQRLAWNFFEKQWNAIRRNFGSGFNTFPKLIGELTTSFKTTADLARLQTFVDSHPDQGSGKRAFEQALEKTMANIRWMNSKVHIVRTWLTNQGFHQMAT